MLRKITQIEHKIEHKLIFCWKSPQKTNNLKKYQSQLIRNTTEFSWNPDVPDDYILGVMV